ncbi:MAG: PDZ domain-containing protein [Clostridiales bacterium]|nr:PDZ domain-containing protein [Clostridiales bacterium]
MQITSLLASGVWKTIGGVAIAIAILLIMVTVHEFGHYVAGKSLGFKINEFSVGFGPAFFKKRSKKTGELFALRIIPLGGYCAFEGEDYEEEKTENEPLFEEFPAKENEAAETVAKERSTEQAAENVTDTAVDKTYPTPKGKKFTDQPPWKRIIVLIAGATMNYLLALFLIVLMFSIYGPVHSYIDYVGDVPPIVGETSVSARDIVLSVDGKDIYFSSDYTSALNGKKQGDVVDVTVLRYNKEQEQWAEKTLQVTLLCDCEFENMTDLAPVYNAFGLDASQYGIANVANRKITGEGFFQVIGKSFVYSWKTAGIVLRSLGELITGKIGITAMGGPGTTIGVTAQAASAGLLSTLNIAAFIGVNLAVFNLLPIPALDGCKVIFCIIEWIRKKPVNRKVETMIHLIGIVFLFGFAILLDVLQWIL